MVRLTQLANMRAILVVVASSPTCGAPGMGLGSTPIRPANVEVNIINLYLLCLFR